MSVRLHPIAREEADAILAGGLPTGLRFADGYPTEFSEGVARNVGAETAVGPFFLVREDDDVVVGEIGGAFVEPGTVEIGYATAGACEGRGYATAGVTALLDLLLSRSERVRVIAHTPADRPASARVLVKAGFASAGEVEDEHEGVVLRVTRWETTIL